jgi:hypothetical protein
VYTDLLQGVRDRVDWDEIAEALLEDCEQWGALLEDCEQWGEEYED